MTTLPTLTPRAAREQSTFRTLLDSMAHPGRVYRLDLSPDSLSPNAGRGPGGGVSHLVRIAEALIDHEVTFAVLPEHAGLTDTLLRQTGSHVAPVEVAAYVFCEAESLAEALRLASDGTPEYPDAGATVVCQVPAISEAGVGAITLSGPGVKDTARVWIEGFSSEACEVLTERNAARPLGLDVIFVAEDGSVVSLARYTRIEEEQ